MKRLPSIIILAALCLLCTSGRRWVPKQPAVAGGGSSPTLIASTVAHNDGASVTTSSLNTTGATLIVIAASNYGANPTPTDSKGNTWTGITAYTASPYTIKLWYCISPTVGAGHTFTNGSDTPTIAVVAFSAVTAYDTGIQNGNSQFGGTTQSTGSVTPSSNNCLVITATAHYSETATHSIDTGFTISNDYPGSPYDGGMAMAYLDVPTAAAKNPTWTYSTGVSRVASAIASFKY